jgi:hypothetical protein
VRIETFAVCHNEERMLPYFLRHYQQYGVVTIFDNESTDRSIEIIENSDAIYFSFNSGGEFREDILTSIRNTCWKESTADWVIITDIDEFVYHRDLEYVLRKSKATVLLPRMFNMYSDTFPDTPRQIYDQVKYGTEFNSKMCIFRPSEITEMNYEAGCHFANPEGNFILDFKTPVINLHFKNMGQEYVNERNAYLFSRNSEVNRANGWNWHMAVSDVDTRKQFEIAKTRLIKVV